MSRAPFSPKTIQALAVILDAAMQATAADLGNIQVVNAADGTLRMIVQRGFGPRFVDFFRVVKLDKSACSAALKARRRIVVRDVRESARYTEPARQTMLAAGAAACQSTPIIAADGMVVGMISTHFRAPHVATAAQLQQVDRLSEEAARTLQQPSPPTRLPAAVIEELRDRWPGKNRMVPSRGVDRHVRRASH